MKYRTRRLLLAAFIAAGVLGIGSYSFAHNSSIKASLISSQTIANDVAAGDYAKWQSDMQASLAQEKADYAQKVNTYQAVLSSINSGNFDSLQQMYQAIENGDTQTAEDIRAKLGLPDMEVFTAVADKYFSLKEFANFPELQKAIQNKDYEAFKSQIQDIPYLRDKITSADKFEVFCEARSLMDNGKTDEAMQIFKTLGLEKPIKKASKIIVEQLTQVD